MKVYEAAKKLGISNKEFCKEYGTKSHLSKISTELEEQLFGGSNEDEVHTTETVSGSDTEGSSVVIEAPVDSGEVSGPDGDGIEPDAPQPVEADCPYTLAEIELGIRGLGNKSPCWKWKHLLNG
jgi:hypothetical protein